MEIISKLTDFKMLPKTNYTSATICLAVFLMGIKSTALKIACSNPRFTLDFVLKYWFCVFNESTDNSKEY